MLRPNFHMRQPSLFGLTSQTWEKFACQVGITASQTNESWPKTTYGHTHTHTNTHSSTPTAWGWHIANPKSQLLWVEMAKPMRRLYPLRFRAKQTKLGHRNWRRVSLYPATPLHPLLPSDLQLIILNKIEFAPLDCCKIIKHGTGLPNPCAAFGTVRLWFSFVGFGNNFVLRPCQVCRGFVPPPASRLAALLLAAAYIIQLNSLPAHFVHAPQWQIVIVSQLCGNCNLHSRIMALLVAPSRAWQLPSDTRYCGYWFHKEIEEMFTVLALFNNLGNILAWTAHSICV